MPLMLRSVQAPKYCWFGPGVFPEALGVDLLCLGLFTVRMLISPPSDGCY